MSDLLNINKGFEAMIPKSPEGEEVTNETSVVSNEIKFKLFGIELPLTITVVTRS